MKFCLLFALFATLAQHAVILAGATTSGEDDDHASVRSLRGKKGRRRCGKKKKLMIELINLTFNHTFGPNFFVAIHDESVDPLFRANEAASGELESLAEDGSADGLVTLYNSTTGVLYAGTNGEPLRPGFVSTGRIFIDIDMVSRDYPYVTIASMFVNSNDGFVAINGQKLEEGDVLNLNGYDAGTEENDELCENIPGPACGDETPSGTVENGFVHIHRGMQDVGDLEPGVYHWQNPMVRAVVQCVAEN